MRVGTRKSSTEYHSVGRDCSGRTDWQSVVQILLALLLFVPSVSSAAEPVRATIGKETAWTGEAVALIITLYSPGPFSGTASFDLPELSRTAFVKSGNPLVGSEEVGDESFLTQRHEFAVYTQGVGEIVIPAFRVRFSGKKTFTSDPEPMEGSTPELRFQSKRPPGTEKLGVIVVAAELEATQTWQPDSIDTVNAGDVIQRTITRRATGTTAMMLPPVASDAPDGIRVYTADPTVQDHTERGQSSAERSDTIKYQFGRAGTFQLPDVSMAWWDVQASELKHKTLPGKTVNVEDAAAANEEAAQEPTSGWSLAPLLVAIVLVSLLAIWPVSGFLTAWRARRSNPEPVAARNLLAACRANDAQAAYAALLAWTRAVSASDEGVHLGAVGNPGQAHDLQDEWKTLSRYVFGINATEASWSGNRLAGAFARARRELKTNACPPRTSAALPALNPTVGWKTTTRSVALGNGINRRSR